MRRLETILLTSAALITLGAGLVYGCKKDYPIAPTQPTPIVTPAPTQEPTYTLTPEPTPTLKPYTPTPKPIEKPTPTTTPTAKPEPTNSYDFAKSLGLEADYLRPLSFDNNAKDFISYLSSLPLQMRAISERSGLVDKLIADKQVNADEQAYFKKIIGSYQKDIEAVQPWLKQISEQKSLEALALNLSNFLEADRKGELFYSLRVEQVPGLLSTGIFFVDGKERKYEDEILTPEAFQRGETATNPYAAAAVKNITNFLGIHNIAWEVANDPKYDEFATNPLAKEYFRLEAVGSTDSGLNAYEDIKLLVQSGSPAAKATLRIYNWNLGEGKKGSRGQARVPLTMADAGSIGINVKGVVIAGHDVPAIPITDKDIALLKTRSIDSLLILDIDGIHYLPFQWTRKTILKTNADTLTLIYDPKAPKEYKISNLKNY